MWLQLFQSFRVCFKCVHVEKASCNSQDQCLKTIKCPILSGHVYELLLCNSTVLLPLSFSVRLDGDMAQCGPGASIPWSQTQRRRGVFNTHTVNKETINKCQLTFIVNVKGLFSHFSSKMLQLLKAETLSGSQWYLDSIVKQYFRFFFSTTKIIADKN